VSFSLFILVFLRPLVLWWILSRVVLRFMLCCVGLVCFADCFVFLLVFLIVYQSFVLPSSFVNYICFVWRKVWAPNL
jgi:hypothetical protein